TLFYQKRGGRGVFFINSYKNNVLRVFLQEKEQKYWKYIKTKEEINMIYKPLVSVIIPTFERSPNLIDRSIKSAQNQTYSNLEIIVIDDSPSTYKKRNEVEKYINSLEDDRLIYIQHNENMGANVARNNGIRHSKGEFCAFLDDDDEWELNKIELQLNKIIESNSGLVYCKGKVIDDKTG